MARISNKQVYKIVEPTSSDYLIGTDAEDFNRTKTFTIQGIADFVSQNVTVGVGSLNGLVGAVTLSAGVGLELTEDGNTLTLSLSTPDFVESINGLVGNVTVQGSTNIGVVDNGTDTITLTALNVAKTNEANTFLQDQTLNKSLTVSSGLLSVNSVSQNVGINKLAPSYQLDVVGDSNITGSTGEVLTLTSPNEVGADYILFNNSLDANKGWVGYKGASDTLQLRSLISDVDIIAVTSVSLSYGGTTRLETTATGIEITGGLDVGDITATSITITGGTSAQFLKADGSLDGTAYQDITEKGQADGYVPLNSLSKIDNTYLPNDLERTTNKGAANGYAPLDSGAKVPIANIPDSVLGQVTYEGTWDANNNLPLLANPPAADTKGDYYVCSSNGTQFGLTFQTGDWIISNGSAWEKVDNTDAVTSVFGRLGNVVANESDYSGFYPLIADLDAEEAARIAGDSNLQTQIDNLPSPNDGTLTVNGIGALNGSGTFTANQSTNSTIDISHDSVGRVDVVDSLSPTFGGSFDVISSVTSSAEGHVTATKLDTITLPTPNDATITLSAGAGISGGGDFTTDQSVNETITFSHADTSSVSNITFSGTVPNEFTFDTYGHVTGVTSRTLLGFGGTSINVYNIPPSGYDFAIELSQFQEQLSNFATGTTINFIDFNGLGFYSNVTGVHSFYGQGTQWSFDILPDYQNNGYTRLSDSQSSNYIEIGSPDASGTYSATLNGTFSTVKAGYQTEFYSNVTGIHKFWNPSSSYSLDISPDNLGTGYTTLLDSKSFGTLDFGLPDVAPYTAVRIQSGASSVQAGYETKFYSNVSGYHNFYGANKNTFFRIDTEGDGFFEITDNSSNIQILGFGNFPGFQYMNLFNGTISISPANWGVEVYSDFNVYGTKNFRIDHPIKPDTHDLVHTVIESNRADVFYRGKSKLVNGKAVINIDEYVGLTSGTFNALTKDVQCFTTNESGWTLVRGNVFGDTLIILAQDETCNDEVSWIVVGERNDEAYLESSNTDDNGRLILEPEREGRWKDRKNKEAEENIIKNDLNTNSI